MDYIVIDLPVVGSAADSNCYSSTQLPCPVLSCPVNNISLSHHQVIEPIEQSGCLVCWDCPTTKSLKWLIVETALVIGHQVVSMFIHSDYTVFLKSNWCTCESFRYESTEHILYRKFHSFPINAKSSYKSISLATALNTMHCVPITMQIQIDIVTVIDIDIAIGSGMLHNVEFQSLDVNWRNSRTSQFTLTGVYCLPSAPGDWNAAQVTHKTKLLIN